MALGSMALGSMDIMRDEVELLSASDLRIMVMALRSVVTLERCTSARAEVEAARWMREAASYRTAVAAERIKRAESENRGERT